MTRSQRRLHAATWLVIGPLVLTLLILALAAHRAPPAPEPPEAEITR